MSLWSVASSSVSPNEPLIEKFKINPYLCQMNLQIMLFVFLQKKFPTSLMEFVLKIGIEVLNGSIHSTNNSPEVFPFHVPNKKYMGNTEPLQIL